MGHYKKNVLMVHINNLVKITDQLFSVKSVDTYLRDIIAIFKPIRM